MSKVTKQPSMTRTLSKERSDKTKSSTKLASTTKKSSSKEATAAYKPKIVKQNGVHSIEEKKSEKKVPATTTKTSSDVKSSKTEKKSDAKVKVRSSVPVGDSNGKSGKKVQSKPDSDKNTLKKVSSVEKPDKTRTKDKSASMQSKATGGKVTETIESTDSSSKSKATSKRQVPLKASHAITKPAESTAIAAVAIAAPALVAVASSTKNVMNQVHNVTVLSPPPVRRESKQIEPQQSERLDRGTVHSSVPRGRTRTRTLSEDEIVLLKPKPTNVGTPISNANSIAAVPSLAMNGIKNESVTLEIKPPISFEVMLREANKVKPPEKILPKPIEMPRENEPKPVEKKDSSNISEVNKSDKESDDYEDDFESYESDFESDVSNEDVDDESENEDSQSQSDSSITTGESESDDNVVSTASKHPFETGHSVGNTEFDSGSFELKVMSARSRAQNGTEPGNASPHDQQFEMQNDSGIENTVGGLAMPVTQNGQLNSLDLNNKTFDNISDIEVEGVNSLDINTAKSSSGKTKTSVSKSRLAKRGEELLSKITLDTMNYVLFDFKPIPYELFMKIYGSSNTTQVAVQTHNDRHDQECQSDIIATRTSWSQHPITFYSNHLERSDLDDYRNGCGFEIDDQTLDNSNENMKNSCERSLSLIRNMSLKMNSSEATKHDIDSESKVNLDYDNLNRFLLENEMTLVRILQTQLHREVYSLMDPVLPISNGYFTLKPTFGTALTNERVQRTFAVDSLPGFLFTLHCDIAHQLNVMALWNLSKLGEPVCLLSVWSKILCVEIHPKIRDIVFAGLEDGSIAVWDYSESKYWHPGLDQEVKRFVPSQITTPSFDSNDSDYGRCIAVRALPIAELLNTDLLNGYNPKQLCSLHECGLLILWTVLINTTGTYTDLVNKRIDHQSMWSKVKLIQSKVIDLRASVKQMSLSKLSRPTSKSFDKTRSYFESELFSDAALQELHQMNTDEEKLLTTFRCTAIELTHQGILISTNENFLLFGRKSFKNESFRRIQLDANKNVRVECIVSLVGFDDDIVVMALNNGAVKSLCCEENLDQIDDLLTGNDIEESSLSISSLTSTNGNRKAPNSNFLPDTLDFVMAPASNGPVQIVTAAPLQAATGFFADGNSPSFGKSCTIQSLVLNERNIYDERQVPNHQDNMEYRAPAETVPIKTMDKPMKCTQLMNGQTMFNNSMDIFSTISRQYLVQLVKSKKMITLRKNRIRIYDLTTNEVVKITPKLSRSKFIDATTMIADHNEEFLVLLNAEGVVELHQIMLDPNNC